MTKYIVIKLFDSTKKQAKYISYLQKPTFSFFYKRKVKETYSSTDLATGKIFCVYVCYHALGQNFYPIDIDFDRQAVL